MIFSVWRTHPELERVPSIARMCTVRPYVPSPTDTHSLTHACAQAGDTSAQRCPQERLEDFARRVTAARCSAAATSVWWCAHRCSGPHLSLIISRPQQHGSTTATTTSATSQTPFVAAVRVVQKRIPFKATQQKRICHCARVEPSVRTACGGSCHAD
jgi:hypothetical protein